MASLTKSGAVSRGYNFASTWEQNAPLTEQQHAAIAALSNAVAERPFPPNLSQDQTSGKDNNISASVRTSYSVEESVAIDVILFNTHQFYKWFTDLESAIKSETEEKCNPYVDTLVERIQICDGIFNQVDDTLNLFDELQMLHQTVATKTKALHDACDRLVSTNFYSLNINIGNGQFLPLLKLLDDCISYVERNAQYAESGVYLVKFRQLKLLENYL